MSLVKHAFVSGIADDPAAAAAGEVLPSHWNADHDISGLFASANVWTDTQEISLSNSSIDEVTATKHLILNNPDSSGQTLIDFITNGVFTGRFRNDFAGGNTYVSGGDAHTFTSGGDFAQAGTEVAQINSNGIYISKILGLLDNIGWLSYDNSGNPTIGDLDENYSGFFLTVQQGAGFDFYVNNGALVSTLDGNGSLQYFGGSSIWWDSGQHEAYYANTFSSGLGSSGYSWQIANSNNGQQLIQGNDDGSMLFAQGGTPNKIGFELLAGATYAADATMVRFGKNVPPSTPSTASIRYFQFTDLFDTTERFSFDMDSSARPIINTRSASHFAVCHSPGGSNVDFIWLNYNGGNGATVGWDNTSPTAYLHCHASTSSNASIRVPTGADPTSPNDGDIWYNSHFKFRQSTINLQLETLPTARVTAQFNKTNDTTLTTVTGLSVNILAGRTYHFRAKLAVSASATTGHKYAIAGTATASAINYQVNSISNATNLFVINSAQTALGGAGVGQTGATGVDTEIEGTITCNGSGTLVVQFAENAGAVSTTSSVLVGSIFEVRDIT